MSGRRIDDHKVWMGAPGKNMVLPDGAKTKGESSATGFGELGLYEDTTEAIKTQQEMNRKQVHSDPRKNYHRN
jgi:hypothetical protein